MKSSITKSLGAALLAATIAASAVGQTSMRKSPVPRYDLLQLSVSSETVDAEEFVARTAEIASCTDARELAEAIGGDVKRDRFVRSSAMPQGLQDMLADLPKGKASPVYSGGEGIMHVMVICNRL